MSGDRGGFSLYCIVPHGVEPAGGVVGIDGAPVRATGRDGPWMWISRSDGAPEANLDRIKAHDRVVRAAMTDLVTPVPLRFGQWVERKEDVLESLVDRLQEYDAALARIAGAVELAVTAPLGSEPDDGPDDGGTSTRTGSDGGVHGPGRTYIEELIAERRKRSDRYRAGLKLAGTLKAALGDRVRESVVPPASSSARGGERTMRPGGGRDPGTIQVCHLVGRADLERYRVAVERLADEMDVGLIVTGPWPPYSFAR